MQLLHGQVNYGGHRARYHMLTAPTTELIVVSGDCYSAAKLEHSTCVPVPLRTGEQAERSCECSETAAPYINCKQAFLSRSPETRVVSYENLQLSNL